MGSWLWQGIIELGISIALLFWLFGGHHGLLAKVMGTAALLILTQMAWDAVMTAFGAWVREPGFVSRQLVLARGHLVLALAVVAAFIALLFR